MFRVPRRVLALVAAVSLVSVQLHVGAGLVACAGTLSKTVPGRAPGPAGGPSGHLCPACLSSGWAVPAGLPRLNFSLQATWLEVEKPRPASRDRLLEPSSSRAPPLV